MKRVLSILVVASFLFIGVGCGDSQESLAGESVDVMKDLNAVLDTVKDGPSAKAARSQLEKLSVKMKDIQSRMARMPAPTEAEIKSMGDKYGKEMEEQAKKMQANAYRLMYNHEVAKELEGVDLK